MAAASGLAMGVFVATVFGVAAVLLYGLSRDVSSRAHSHLAVAVVVLALWLVPPAVAARSGVLDRYDAMPPPVFMMVAGYALGVAALAFSAPGARLIASLGLGGIAGLQGFRILVEWVLHRLYLDGAVPVQMTYAGRNFDIDSGVSGAALGLWILSRRPVPRSVVLAWNVVCLGLLVNIVVVAILSTPVRFRYFMNEPVNLLPSVFPWVWLPMFLVQVALLGHLLVFRMLGTRAPAFAGGRT
jgi:hypothetical protein